MTARRTKNVNSAAPCLVYFGTRMKYGIGIGEPYRVKNINTFNLWPNICSKERRPLHYFVLSL